MSSSLARTRVLVTGADGFIGSHLVDQLVAHGAHVRALVYYNSWNSIGWLEDTEAFAGREVEIVHGDVRDAGMIARAVDGIDVIFHLAALIGIPYSYEAPRSYIDTNVIGTLNVLEAARASSRITRVVHTSTSETYGSAQRVPMSEDHPLVGQSPYAASKIAADQLATSYHRSFGVPVVTSRPFNTFGPRQTPRAVIPTVIAQALSGAATISLGATAPTRDFNFVEDTVAGMIALALCDRAIGQVVNIGSGREHSIGETARLILERCGSSATIVCDAERIRPPASEVERLLCDASLLHELTGWTPSFTMEAGLDRTIAWWRNRDAARYASGYVR